LRPAGHAAASAKIEEKLMQFEKNGRFEGPREMIGAVGWK
jgi:hypothetical protein